MASWVQPVALTAAVILFYIVMWFREGRDPRPGTIVTQYEPPRAMSPALIRYCWKQSFDERVVWAGLLSLVSRGLATLETGEGATYIRPVWPPLRHPALPKEEFALYDKLATARGRPGVRLSLLDDVMADMAVGMATVLHAGQQGRWFQQNRNVVLAGSVLSAVALLMAANPSSTDTLFALLIPAALMAVGGFYSFFLMQRILALLQVTTEHVKPPIVRRLMMIVLLALPNLTAVALGSIIIYFNFGVFLLALAAALSAVNLLFLHLMKAPTIEGRKLLDEIEGFRRFLETVEHLPFDLPQAPGSQPGAYEKYLPYALAMEVEQQWCDQLCAIASSDHDNANFDGAHVFYLGMWEGRPVEVAYAPGHPRRS